METTVNTFSSKASTTLTTGIAYGVNEMAETGMSMGLSNGRRYVVSGMTDDMDDGIMKEMLQDGLSSTMSMWTGAVMRAQESVLEKTIAVGAVAVGAWYGKSRLKGFLNGKGRKMALLGKFIGSNNSKAEEERLIADFSKMNVDSIASSNNPQTHNATIQNKQQFENLQVNKEGVRSQLARLQTDGMRDTFEMKLKTSSFFNTDKTLISSMTGMLTVTDVDIKKLNSLSSSMVSQDSSGNWVGGNQAMIELLSALRLQRA